ncbi:hypothetical protein EC968_010287 [Mortierella alpina]|nr:hypothetical protein EC968_010287 [Mortierella alpina]
MAVAWRLVVTEVVSKTRCWLGSFKLDGMDGEQSPALESVPATKAISQSTQCGLDIPKHTLQDAPNEREIKVGNSFNAIPVISSAQNPTTVALRIVNRAGIWNSRVRNCTND